MIEKVFVLVCEIFLISTATSGIAIILSATWYDIRSIAKRQQLLMSSKKLRAPTQPSIAILVYLQEDTHALTRCLKSITASKYKNYRVVVISNGNSKNKSKAVRAYRRLHRKSPVTFYTKKIPVKRLVALQAGYKKIPASDFVMVINSTDTIPPALLKMTASHFKINPSLNALRIQQRFTAPLSITSLVYKFASLSYNLFYKAISSYSINSVHIGSSGVVTTHAIFLKRQPHLKTGRQYISDTYIESELLHHRSIHPAATFFLQVAVISVMTYDFITAATLLSNALLILSWLIVTLWLLASIWSNTQLTIGEKSELTFSAPITYFLMYVYLIANLGITIRSAYFHLTSKLLIKPGVYLKAIRKQT